MEELQRVRIRAGGGYTVTIGPGLLPRCGALLAETIPPCRAAVVTDSTVAERYLPAVRASLEAAGFPVCHFIFPAGEDAKTLSTLSEVLNFLAGQHLTRADLVVTLGGGVAGDLGGFAAGVYHRGIRFVQLPTTLLAAVDASVGGKTAVDLPQGKNLAGVFWQPSAVLCDTLCLSTQPAHGVADGVAEVIKYGVLADRALFDAFDADRLPEPERMPALIARCVAIKGALVEEDPLDHGRRRLLNLGHTIGHAIEACSGFSLSHGRAVAIGMAMVARAAERLSLAVPGTAAAISRVLRRNGLPVTTDYPAQALYSAALSDKKRGGDQITLVIPRAIGDCVLHTIPVPELARIIALGKEEPPCI
ncbi:MAG: 3-dehydroquinate synthase [Clostridiales bacterium]|nr:3-dehydroquinate synthase [Clostridiales bacterium]